jgi:hypothetical protein
VLQLLLHVKAAPLVHFLPLWGRPHPILAQLAQLVLGRQLVPICAPTAILALFLLFKGPLVMLAVSIVMLALGLLPARVVATFAHPDFVEPIVLSMPPQPLLF